MRAWQTWNAAIKFVHGGSTPSACSCSVEVICMTKYTFAERVYKKVKKLLSCNPQAKEIMSCCPAIELDENFCLSSLCWHFYNLDILVTDTAITYHNRGQRQVLYTYAGFDALLKL